MKFTVRRDDATHIMNRHWQFCIGSGHAPLALRTDYVRMLKKVREELGVEYVRFHGIFCDDMNVYTKLSDLMPVPGAEKFREYNFHKIGTAYDNLLECGVKPFVELSFMPKHLAEDQKNGLFFYDCCNASPKDYEAWADFIRKFISYLIHRYGAEEVETWYFEVWNEPDLMSAFAEGAKLGYFKLYDATARAIKDINPRLRVGGPATSCSRWVGSFLEYCRAHNTPVDFITTHQYAGDPFAGVVAPEDLEAELEPMDIRMLGREKALLECEGGSMLEGLRKLIRDTKTRTVGDTACGMSENAAYVKTLNNDLPLYYTEWNLSGVFSNPDNDTRMAAAYDLRTALLCDGKMEGSSVWCFSDLFEEMHHFPEEFHGGFGMLTSNGIPKPVYHGFRLLREVSDLRIDMADGNQKEDVTCAAFRAENETQVLLIRQKLDPNGTVPTSVRVAVEWEDALCKVTMKRIDENHGNPYKFWEAMGKPTDMNKAEIQQIVEASMLREEICPVSMENGEALCDIMMDANDIYLLRFQK